ncbi:NUDIX domain-containing protein [Terribacillus sp. 179-K 1B1 HS]|uniref:NUDIX domain-containing protein n=1 Tax=Terribacillus sp. 179-K 1B1 HS TaxID=3142388 RepID=UPI0039A0CDD1
MHLFGTKEPDQKYIKRLAVYGIMYDHSSRIGVIQRTYDKLLFLPGGGMEKEENELETLRREVMEETGYSISKPSFLCEATQFFQSRDGSQYIQNIASFLAVRLD